MMLTNKLSDSARLRIPHLQVTSVKLKHVDCTSKPQKCDLKTCKLPRLFPKSEPKSPALIAARPPQYNEHSIK